MVFFIFFLSKFELKLLEANIDDSDLDLHCFSMSHKKDARFIGVNLHTHMYRNSSIVCDYTYICDRHEACYLSKVKK